MNRDPKQEALRRAQAWLDVMLKAPSLCADCLMLAKQKRPAPHAKRPSGAGTQGRQAPAGEGFGDC
jgi:hypothetical protein